MPSEDTRGAFYGVTKYMSDYKDKDASKCHRGPMLPQPNNIAVDKDAKLVLVHHLKEVELNAINPVYLWVLINR